MDGNVFFLHLPSTDGYGSVFKPPSAEYQANINAVDAGVSRTVYCTVLYCTVLYCTVLCCTVLYCTVLCVSCTGRGGGLMLTTCGDQSSGTTWPPPSHHHLRSRVGVFHIDMKYDVICQEIFVD